MFEKDLAVAALLDVYAEVLNARHRTVLDLYYNQDYSLGEIAAEEGISRQGVRDSIKKAEDELHFLENGLHLAARNEEIRLAGEALLSLVDEKNTELRAAALRLLAAAGQND